MDRTIKEGTELVIDADFTEAIDNAVENEVITVREHEEFASAAYGEWLPRTIKFISSRINRKSVYLTWYFLDEDLADTPHYNLTIFKKLGYKIIDPEQVTLDLCSCPDMYLNSREIVHKYLILQNPGRVSTWYDGVMGILDNAMAVKGIVFYQP